MVINTCVGAHVILKRQNEQGEEEFMFAVIPACKVCNNVKNEYSLVWECTAVTILNFQTLTFVGNIYVPRQKFRTRGAKDTLKRLAREAREAGGDVDKFDWIKNSEFDGETAAKSLLAYYEENNMEIDEFFVRRGYWKEITGIKTENANKKTIKITGKTRNCKKNDKPVTYTYDDPDAFLQALVLLYQIKSTINSNRPLTRTTTDSKNFVAESVIVNEGNYPTNCEAYKNNSVETANASDSDTGVGVGESKEDSS